MYLKQFYIICVFGFLLQRTMAEIPKFRISAPPFVCPKDRQSPIDLLDFSVITVHTEPGSKLNFNWTVRSDWCILKSPSQRFTISLWKTVRYLEKVLNEPPAEPGVYFIDNINLLNGVTYLFNVTATDPEGENRIEKSFNITSVIGSPRTFLEARANFFFIELIGSEVTYTDLQYTVEASVTTCNRTNDIYFTWSVSSDVNVVDVFHIKGSRLGIKPYTLIPGLSYDVFCQVNQYSNSQRIGEKKLSFQVLHRKLNVYFNADAMSISVGVPFGIQTNIKQLDYKPDKLEIDYMCSYNNTPYKDFEIDSDGWLIFPAGLPQLGEYLISMTVTVIGIPGKAKSSARILTVEPRLPVIEVSLVPRLATENAIVNLKANVRRMVPGCAIAWYFLHYECKFPKKKSYRRKCSKDPRGYRISEPVHYFSLEENFLMDLTDFTNEVTAKVAVASLEAAKGTARIVAECKCKSENTTNCSNAGQVYGEIYLKVNQKPRAEPVVVMPRTGKALETMYRISTLALEDVNKPIRYTFYCNLGNNDTLILGTYLEHYAMETLLPYVGDGTKVWVEVCDALQACSMSKPTLVQQMTGEGRSMEVLIEDVQTHVKRCEIGRLMKLAKSAISTYIHIDERFALSNFTAAVLDSLRNIDKQCSRHYLYAAFLDWLEDITYRQIFLYDSFES